MKKKLLALCLTIGVILSLTGCNLNFGKDKSDNVVEVDKVDLLSPAGTSYEVGTVVNINDIVKVKDEFASNVSNLVFMDANGSVSETIEVTQAGESYYTIVAQFNDGTSWDGSWFLLGTEKQLPEYVENIKSAIDEGAPYEVGKADSTSVTLLNKKSLENKNASGSSDINGIRYTIALYLSDASNVENCSVQLTKCTEDELLKSGKDSGDNVLVSVFSNLYNNYKDTFKYKEEDMALVEEASFKLIDSFRTVKKTETPVFNIYDVEGNIYPVYNIKYTLDAGALLLGDSSTITIDDSYFVDYNGSKILLLYSNNNLTSPLSIFDYDATKLPKIKAADYDLKTTEGWLKLLKDTIGVTNEHNKIGISTVSMDYADEVSEIFNGNLLIGEYYKSGTDNTNVTVDTKEEPKEEVKDTIAETKPLYSSKYPEIYTWPEGKVQYRRWNYVIDESTTFVGSIIYPDGSRYVGTGEVNVQGGTNTGTGNNGASNSNGEQKHSLSSTYATYELTNAGNSSIQFDLPNSTSGRLVFTYAGNKYYVETVKTADINKYATNCIYSTSKFRNNNFEVEPNATASKTTTKGKIIPYEIYYNDVNTGYNKVSPYMAVYNINNDYLCIYADNMPSSNEMFMTLLSTIVK